MCFCFPGLEKTPVAVDRSSSKVLGLTGPHRRSTGPEASGPPVGWFLFCRLVLGSWAEILPASIPRPIKPHDQSFSFPTPGGRGGRSFPRPEGGQSPPLVDAEDYRNVDLLFGGAVPKGLKELAETVWAVE